MDAERQARDELDARQRYQTSGRLRGISARPQEALDGGTELTSEEHLVSNPPPVIPAEPIDKQSGQRHKGMLEAFGRQPYGHGHETGLPSDQIASGSGLDFGQSSERARWHSVGASSERGVNPVRRGLEGSARTVAAFAYPLVL